MFALDETANISPIPDLPSIASQGGSQGVVVLAVFQHLDQAKQRWGAEGEGFLTNFQERLVFPGIWQQDTLEAISAVIGDYDRPVTSMTQDANSADPKTRATRTRRSGRGSFPPPTSAWACRGCPKWHCSCRDDSTLDPRHPLLQLSSVASVPGERHGALEQG